MINTEKERKWHDELYKEGATPEESIRSGILFAYVSAEYPQRIFKKLQKFKNLRVLDVGCGRGIQRAQSFVSNGCNYTGIDISIECIKANLKDAKRESLEANFIVEDANKMDSLKEEAFDVIILTGTLHHLDLNKILPVMKRLTQKTKGKVIMMEPMGTNPILNLFRKLTPKLRSPDEHPLIFKDLDLIRHYFPKTEYSFHTLSALLVIPLGIIPLHIFRKLCKSIAIFLGKVDEKLLCKIPIVKRLSWNVIIVAS